MSVTALPRAVTRAPAAPRIEGSLARTGARSFAGHAIDPQEPHRRLAVELLVDGLVVAVTRADLHDPVLATEDRDGRHAFRFVLDDMALEPGMIVAARLANLDLAVGAPLTCGIDAIAPAALPGRVRPLGALRFGGWTAPRDGEAYVTIAVDGETIAEVPAVGWTRDQAGGESALPAFDLHLSDRFADGRVHRLVARNAAGESLAGSPLAFVADAGTSVPMRDYARWRERHPPAPASFAGEIAVIAAGDGAFAATLSSLEEQDHADWIAVALPGAAPGPTFDAPAALAFLEGEADTSRVILFCLAGTHLHAGALARLAAALAARPDAVAAFGDVEIAAADGALWPLFFPAFDRERFLEQGHAALAFALPTAIARQAIAGGADDLVALFHAAIALRPGAPVIALPGALATLPRLDRDALTASLRTAVRRALPGAVIAPGATTPLPSIRVTRRTEASATIALIAPLVSERGEALLAALEPIRGRIPVELVTIAGDADRIGAPIRRIPGEGTRARLVDAALGSARTDFVCILDDRMIAPPDLDWLDELLSRALDADVAAVAPIVLGPEGLVRHAGAVLGPGFALAPAFADAAPSDPGHAGALAVAREVSALLPGCILYRRSAFIAAGGMDATRFPQSFADADLCLRLRRAGHRIIVTPHARITDTRPALPAPSARELHAFRARWGEALIADPFYSPMLAIDALPWTALAEPPRDAAARLPDPSPIVELPPGF